MAELIPPLTLFCVSPLGFILRPVHFSSCGSSLSGRDNAPPGSSKRNTFHAGRRCLILHPHTRIHTVFFSERLLDIIAAHFCTSSSGFGISHKPSRSVPHRSTWAIRLVWLSTTPRYFHIRPGFIRGLSRPYRILASKQYHATGR